MKHAINAVANPQVLAERLEVDVRRPLLETLSQDRVHKLHDRGLAVLLINDIDLFLCAADFIFPALDEFLERIGTDAIRCFQRFNEPSAGGQHKPHGSRPVLDHGLPAAVVKRIKSQKPHLPAFNDGLGQDGLTERQPRGKFLADVFDDLNVAFLAPGKGERRGEGF